MTVNGNGKAKPWSRAVEDALNRAAARRRPGLPDATSIHSWDEPVYRGAVPGPIRILLI
jgi:hypothetical protein